jgi:predicted small secreted protein
MSKSLLRALVAVSLILLLSTLLAACEGGNQQQGEGQSTPGALDGKTLVEERCTKCHGLDRIESIGKTREEWETTVKRMVGKGANLNAEEQAAVVEYLAETYPK